MAGLVLCANARNFVLLASPPRTLWDTKRTGSAAALNLGETTLCRRLLIRFSGCADVRQKGVEILHIVTQHGNYARNCRPKYPIVHAQSHLLHVIG